MSVEAVVYEVIKNRLPPGIGFSDFLRSAEKFTFFPVISNGAIVGAYFNRGNEVHAAVMPEARGMWFSKRVVRWINSLLSEYGVLTTKVMADHIPGHEFAKRLGFVKTGQTGQIVYYKKESSCA